MGNISYEKLTKYCVMKNGKIWYCPQFYKYMFYQEFWNNGVISKTCEILHF